MMPNDSGQNLSIASLFGQAFAGLRRNWLSIFLSTIMIFGTSYALIYFVQRSFNRMFYSSIFIQEALITTLIPSLYAVAHLIATMAILSIVGKSQRKQSVLALSAMLTALKRLPVALGSCFVAWLALTLGYCLLVFPGLILMTAFYVTVPVCTEEKRGVIGSLRRSAALTDQRRWKIFGLAILIFIIEWSGVIMLDIWLLVFRKPAIGLAFYIAANVWRLVVTAYVAVLLSLIYERLRILKDGLGAPAIADIFD